MRKLERNYKQKQKKKCLEGGTRPLFSIKQENKIKEDRKNIKNKVKKQSESRRKRNK